MDEGPAKTPVQSPDRYCAISSFVGARFILRLIASPREASAMYESPVLQW